MKNTVKLVWYWVVERLYHFSMAVLKFVSTGRAVAWRAVNAERPPSGCPGDCLNRVKGMRPIEWTIKNGEPWPIYRVALFKTPLQGVNLRHGIPVSFMMSYFNVLPKDSVIVDARYGLSFGQAVEFLVQSKEFPELAEGQLFPEIQFIMTSRVLDYEEAESKGYNIEQTVTGWRIDPFI